MLKCFWWKPVPLQFFHDDLILVNITHSSNGTKLQVEYGSGSKVTYMVVTYSLDVMFTTKIPVWIRDYSRAFVLL